MAAVPELINGDDRLQENSFVRFYAALADVLVALRASRPELWRGGVGRHREASLHLAPARRRRIDEREEKMIRRVRHLAIDLLAIAAMVATLTLIVTVPPRVGPLDRAWTAVCARIWPAKRNQPPANLHDLIRAGPGHHEPTDEGR